MSNQSNPYVWYVAYGSNINLDRFLVYIQGGIAKNGNLVQAGCADRSLPKDDRALEIPNSIYFSGESIRWQGGVTFITPVAGVVPAKVRAYLIKLSQFWDVVQQENSWQAPFKPVDIDIVRRKGSAVITNPDDTPLPGDSYSRVVYCGNLDDIPMLTVTAPTAFAQALKPSAPYLHLVGSGIQQAHKLSAQEVAAYLQKVPGVTGNYTATELVAIIQEA